mmetsp:Transcript_64560/g.204127  ORF Transcript_64560/g.204127 Transcript_64560/m.204127 type:complete len:512 (-) Transcript_64560:89-1624(-)
MAIADDAAREQMCTEVKELLAQGEVKEALAIAENGLQRFTEAADKVGEASALFMQAMASAKINYDDPGTSLLMAQKALAAVQEADDRADLAPATLMVGELYFANGELDEATRVAREASSLYQQTEDQSGGAACSLLVSDIHLMRDEPDAAMEEAVKAFNVYSEAGDQGGMASAKHKESKAHKMNGQHLEALRAAELASKFWHSARDMSNETRSTVAEAEAKVALLEEREEKTDTNIWVMQLVQTAAAMAKKHRKGDHVTYGNAMYTLAQVLVHSNGLKGATQAAREAAKCFRKAGMDGHVARATLVWAEAEFKMGLFEDAQERTTRVISMLERSTDEDGKVKAYDLLDDIHYQLGLPTRAELAERQRQMMMMQQQQMMMQQQAQFANMQRPMQLTPIQHAQEEVAAPGGGGPPAAFTREGSPLDMSAGMDPAIIRAKVSELAGAIIGDTEDLEVDTPLMEAGLTSNSAVLLRDELTKDLPGINLPPTLIFDYPSVAAIADFVAEASKKLKK